MKKIYFILALCLFGFYIQAQTYTSISQVSGLQYPVAFDVAPDGRFFITEKGDGSNTSSQKARIRVYSNSGSLLGTFYDLSDSTNSGFERGVLGISLDPAFASNHYVYVYYNHLYNGDERIRIVRFTESSNIGTAPFIIFDLDVAENIAGNHVGGNLHFRPSQPNQLYFALGDMGAQQSNPTLNFANKLTNPYGKILRINKNGTIPTDNPFYDNGNPLTSNCDWIWSYGHRNPFDFCFNPVTDSMYSSENGASTWDEANLITKGSFYGWAQCEGNHVTGSTTNLCNAAGAVNPVTTWPSPLPSVTGILYYSGNTWSALNNHLLVAENNSGYIYDCTLGNAPAYNVVTNMVQLGDFTTSGGLTTLKQSSDGCVFAMKGGYTTNGQIYKICPTTTGLNEISSLVSTNIYPNPAKNKLNVEIELLNEKTMEIQLVDIYGRFIKTEQKDFKSGKTTITIDVSDIKPGMYFINIKDISSGQINSSGKIIIE